MPWPGNRFTSSLGRIRGTRPPISNVSKSSDTARTRWDHEIQNTRDIVDFLQSGFDRPSAEVLSALAEKTSIYLQSLDIAANVSIQESDSYLERLVNQHQASSTNEVAIIAVIHALSTPTAIRLVKAMLTSYTPRHLRFLILCCEININLISEEEMELVMSLLSLISVPIQDSVYQQIQALVQAITLTTKPLSWVTPAVIMTTLVEFSIRKRLLDRLHSDLENNQYISLFHFLSGLSQVPGLPNHDFAKSILNESFPQWLWMMNWKPDQGRIKQWHDTEFTDAQRGKLQKALALDGPDLATHKEESLKLAVPHCFAYINVDPQSSDMVELFLDLLYRSTIAEACAIDLFIHLCIDQTANEKSFHIMELALRERDLDYYTHLLHFFQAFHDNTQNLTAQLQYLIKALSEIKITLKRQAANNLVAMFSSQLCDVLQAAQNEFCTQLQTGTGEYIGMLLYHFGRSILRVEVFHSSIPMDVMLQLQTLPPQEVLEAVFDRFQEDESLIECPDSRYKSYLLSVLGGRGGSMDDITLSMLQDEITFWTSRPGTSKRGYAQKLAKLRHLSYERYTLTLLVMLDQDDQFIIQMKNMIKMNTKDCFLDFARYLTSRRKLKQLQNACWVFVLVSLIEEHGISTLVQTAAQTAAADWVEVADELTFLIMPIFSTLPRSGPKISQELISWWNFISQDGRPVLEYFLRKEQGKMSLAWLYFPATQLQWANLRRLLQIWDEDSSSNNTIMSFLKHDGSNVDIVCQCIDAVRGVTVLGTAVLERILRRMAGQSSWSISAIRFFTRHWQQSESISMPDRLAVAALGDLFQVPDKPQAPLTSEVDSNVSAFKTEFASLIANARSLESLRWKMERKEPTKLASLLTQVGIENFRSVDAPQGRLSPDLIDSLSIINEGDYELCFELTSLSELRRKALGIPSAARILLLRIKDENGPKVAITFNLPDQEEDSLTFSNPFDRHQTALVHSNLFLYYIGSHLCNIMSSLEWQYSLQSVHSRISKLITLSPSTCIFCQKSLSVRLWKPATCSKDCSVQLRAVPLEVRLHNLLIDPLSIDLLLTSLYACADENSSLTLLPGCPVAISQIRNIIDTFPPLENLQTATDFRAALHGSDAFGNVRERLLSWLCLSFRGFMITASDGFIVPSMPGTIQFLLLNSHHERESAFQEQRASTGGGTGPVFHGTKISRLFLILTRGLVTMSNTRFMAHGAAAGPGVYCADSQATSLPYAGSTGQSWRHSKLHNMKIMLGCELAGYKPSKIHTISVDERLLVRYVFLLPHNFVSPPRHHVDQALNTAFAKLHSGIVQ